MGNWRVDTSGWPIVVHSVEGTLADEEIDAFILEGTAVLLRGEPHVTIMDASRIGKVTAYTRARSVEWQREHAARLREHCLGTAYVLASPVLRFIAMTVVMVTRLPTPLHVSKSLDEALTWAHGRLAERDPPGEG